MTDYSKGQIYKVIDTGLNMCYIGSTAQKLCKRMAQHRRDYKKFLNNCDERRNTTIFKIFEEHGVENCKIELIEKYPCECKEELLSREGHFIKQMDCVNKHIMGRTNKEYYEDNKNEVLAKCKIYREREDKKEHIKARKKQYYQKRREYILQKTQEYRDNHKEERREYFKKRYENKKH